MPDEKIKEDPTKKLQELVRKRDTKLIVAKQDQSSNYTRRTRSGSFTAEVYSSYDE